MINFRKPAAFFSDQDGTLTSVSAFMAAAASRADRYGLNLQYHALNAFRGTKKIAAVAFGETLPHAALLRIQTSLVRHMTRKRIGTEEMLADMRSLDIPMEIISNAPRRWGRRITDEAGLTPYFDRCHYREDMGGRPKPDPALLVERIRALKLREGSTVMVLGDRRQDVKLALAAGREVFSDGISVQPATFVGTAAAYMIAASQNPGHLAANENGLDGVIFQDMRHISNALRFLHRQQQEFSPAARLKR